MDKWLFESSTGNLVHLSRKFFSIEGLWVQTNFESSTVSMWTQPIINQPEIGILGIITKKIDGILYFLMQAKMEPGNLNMLQLAPTVQATRSNYLRVHQGNTTPYLEYFLNLSQRKVLLDSLQSEQGGRFLRKRNRNIIIEITKNIPLLDDYCWLTLGQIHQLLQQDNIVNMDSRSVLSCISFSAPELQGVKTEDLRSKIGSLSNVNTKLLQINFSDFQASLIDSAIGDRYSLHNTDAIISWFTEQKVRFELNIEKIPLKLLSHWYKTDYEIRHDEDLYFSVIAVAVEAGNREVKTWKQPLVKPCDAGVITYIVKKINGVLHFLVQAKVEPGNFDVVEIAPTVQCITRSYQSVSHENWPHFLGYVLNASSEQKHYEAFQSEEGGRFFQEQNKNMIVEVDERFSIEVPDSFIWMTIAQLKRFIKYNNFVNVEGRCLLSCLSFR
jgi:oxidase EvaA